ncbi:unnamed protein product, partial [Laminaria digitata]
GCSWKEYTFQAAAEACLLDIPKWVRAQGCPGRHWDEWISTSAAAAGRLNILQGARAKGCP